MERRFWQYLNTHVAGDLDADNNLRMLGCNGWEAFAIHALPGAHWIVFLKREIDEEAAKQVDPYSGTADNRLAG